MPPVRKQKNKKSPKKEEVTTVEVEETPVVSGQLNKKLKAQNRRRAVIAAKKRGVVFIKHLPHGFFEEQLKKYFEQFGKVTRLRLARSKRTGGSKGFAFIEFEYPEVAQVAADTMDNYLMFNKLVKATYIPPEKQEFNYFKSTVRRVKNKAGKEIWVSGKTRSIVQQNQKLNDWSVDKYQLRTSSKLAKIEKLNEKYKHLGIDFSTIVFEPAKIDNTVKAETEIASGSSNAVETSTEATANRNKNKKLKKDKPLELADLLGTTINEDSDDEDFIATPASENEDDDDVTSDEETYGMSKDSDNDDDDEEVSESEIATSVQKSKGKKTPLTKPAKPPKLDRFEQLVKRKPQSGGIQKPKNGKKSNVKVSTKTSNKLKVAAAKDLIKSQGPLVSIKGNTTKSKKAKK